MLESTFLSSSLMNIMKRTGPRTKPCGTPLITSPQGEEAPFNTTCCRQSAKKLLRIVTELEEAVDLMKHFSAEKGLELAMNTVSPKYGRRGIGKQLVEESERLAQAKGCQFAVAQATSNYSQSYFNKLGYETLYEMKYEGYLYKGEPLDTAKMAPHTSAKVMAKRLATK